MRAKTQVVVKLISPRKACEGREVHGIQNMTVVSLWQDFRKDLNHPPTAVGGIFVLRAEFSGERI